MTRMKGTCLRTGDRVVMTAHARRQFPEAIQYGVVRSVRLMPKAIRIQREGQKTVETWHPSYWQREPKKAWHK